MRDLKEGDWVRIASDDPDIRWYIGFMAQVYYAGYSGIGVWVYRGRDCEALTLSRKDVMFCHEGILKIWT